MIKVKVLIYFYHRMHLRNHSYLVILRDVVSVIRMMDGIMVMVPGIVIVGCIAILSICFWIGLCIYEGLVMVRLTDLRVNHIIEELMLWYRHLIWISLYFISRWEFMESIVYLMRLGMGQWLLLKGQVFVLMNYWWIFYQSQALRKQFLDIVNTIKLAQQ